MSVKCITSKISTIL